MILLICLTLLLGPGPGGGGEPGVPGGGGGAAASRLCESAQPKFANFITFTENQLANFVSAFLPLSLA